MLTMLLLPTLLTLLPTTLATSIPQTVSPGLNYSTNPNTTASIPSCTNLTLAPSIPCYTTLNTTSYLLNYNSTKAEVCAPEEPWSRCLMRSVYEVAGANCTAQAPGVRYCLPFDCGRLNSTTCVQPRRTNQTSITQIEAQGWYAVYNVYAVYQHVLAWASALNQPSSEAAILASINPRVANTATSVLSNIIPKYSINKNADDALVQLIKNTEPEHENAYGNVRIRGESSTLSGPEWRSVLYARLDLALGMANANGGFDVWLGGVKGGAFSTKGLAGRRKLGRRLAGGSQGVVLRDG